MYSINRIRLSATEFFSAGGYLIFLGALFAHGDLQLRQYCLYAGIACSFLAWLLNFNRARLIADLPTSRIGSAAQGYVELFGRAKIAESNLLRSPLSGTLCIWYRFSIYEKNGDKGWHQISNGASDATMEISDGTGTCFVDPDHAEIIKPERKERIVQGQKQVEELLFAGTIYVLGEFVTIGGAGATLSLREDVSALLAEWKMNKPNLLARFDLDGNGEIDQNEWELARKAAIREVEQEHREIRAMPGTHVMRAPRDGRPYLIATQSPQKLRLHFVLWSYLHLAIMFALAIAIVRLW